MNDKVKALKAHISLDVKNVSESVKFYQKLFNIEPLKVREDYAKFDVQNPPLNLALNQVSNSGSGTLSHLGIQVSSTADVLETKKQWEKFGLETSDEMQTNCCYALQDKTWVADPDGNEWEVFVVLDDILQETNMCCVGDGSESAAGEIANAEISCCDKMTAQIGSDEQKSCC